MHAVPLLLSTVVAIAVTPAVLRALRAAGSVRPNWRDRALPFPAGLAVVVAGLLALAPLAAVEELGDPGVLSSDVAPIALYVLGVALLGLIDDVWDAPARGLRGHARAVGSGELSSGALKAVGALALALLSLSGRGLEPLEYLLAVALLVLATNLFNLLDLRPGRSAKVLVVLGAGLTLGTWDAAPLWALGLWVGPVLVVGLHDLRERAMLGDTGANLLGAVAGLWLVLALGTAGQVVALVVVLLLTVLGELRSLTALIEGNPLLRRLDSIGRPA